MDRQQLLDLADRCEQTTGPDRRLDADIHCALNPEFHVDERDSGVIFVVKNLDERGGFYTGAKAYTASLDAAMTLMPEGWLWQVNLWANGASAECASVKPYEPCGRYQAATPALALCAAALRARAA